MLDTAKMERYVWVVHPKNIRLLCAVIVGPEQVEVRGEPFANQTTSRKEFNRSRHLYG